MTDQADYEEIVDGTIDDVKDAVADLEDVDYRELLEAEQAGKDRVTLTDWIQEQMDDAAEATETVAPSTSPSTDSGGQDAAASLLDRRATVFGVGLAVGLIIAAALAFAGALPGAGSSGPSGAITASEAGDRLETYLGDNKQSLRLPESTEIAVSDVTWDDTVGMYSATASVTAQVQNETVNQDLEFYITENGRYLFASSPMQPIDMTQPVSEQLPQQPQLQQRPSGQ